MKPSGFGGTGSGHCEHQLTVGDLFGSSIRSRNGVGMRTWCSRRSTESATVSGAPLIMKADLTALSQGNQRAASTTLRKLMRRPGHAEVLVTARPTWRRCVIRASKTQEPPFRRKRAMPRFRRMPGPQKFGSVHTPVFSQASQGRSLARAAVHKGRSLCRFWFFSQARNPRIAQPL